MSAPSGGASWLFTAPAARWLFWGALIALLAGWEPGTEQIRHALTTASLVMIAVLLLDVFVTTVVAAGSRAKRGLTGRRSQSPRQVPAQVPAQGRARR